MKFLIADDHELFLQGLEFILHKEYSKAEIVPASNYDDIFKILQKQKDFDLIITDLAMPGTNWLDALKKIHTLCPETPIIIISAVFDREILQKTFDIGVSGYVSKSFPNNVIIGAINLVLAGGMYIPPEVLKMGIQKVPEPMHELIKEADVGKMQVSDNTTKITPRQLEVLRCLADGLSNKQIAYQLGLSEGTVKIHITLLMRALDVSNRVMAVKEASRRGLLSDKQWES